MAFLINRKAPSRIECLYSLLKFLNKNFNGKTFSLEDCMFSREEDNVHNYCSLIQKTDFGYKCPYKESPLSDAGCYITNGKLEDTTKKKEVGNTINALHGMGFVIREDHDIKLSETGKKLVEMDLFSADAANLIQKSILSYGPVVGAFDEIENISVKGIFNAKDIAVGYPVTEETVFEDGNFVTISSGSTTDANTRSRSCYLSWLVTAGVIEPIGIEPDCRSNIPYEKYRTFLNADTLSARKYKVIMQPQSVYRLIAKTDHPLDFINLTKRTMALRENGQAAVREVTMKYEHRIQNRRFAILYLLNNAYCNSTFLSYRQLLDFMKRNKQHFVISLDNFDDVLRDELHIANVGGIPFRSEITDNDIRLYPKVGINIEELSANAPKSLITLIKSF